MLQFKTNFLCQFSVKNLKCRLYLQISPVGLACLKSININILNTFYSSESVRKCILLEHIKNSLLVLCFITKWKNTSQSRCLIFLVFYTSENITVFIFRMEFAFVGYFLSFLLQFLRYFTEERNSTNLKCKITDCLETWNFQVLVEQLTYLKLAIVSFFTRNIIWS